MRLCQLPKAETPRFQRTHTVLQRPERVSSSANEDKLEEINTFLKKQRHTQWCCEGNIFMETSRQTGRSNIPTSALQLSSHHIHSLVARLRDRPISGLTKESRLHGWLKVSRRVCSTAASAPFVASTPRREHAACHLSSSAFLFREEEMKR